MSFDDPLPHFLRRLHPTSVQVADAHCGVVIDPWNVVYDVYMRVGEVWHRYRTPSLEKRSDSIQHAIKELDAFRLMYELWRATLWSFPIAFRGFPVVIVWTRGAYPATEALRAWEAMYGNSGLCVAQLKYLGAADTEGELFDHLTRSSSLYGLNPP